MKKNPSACDCTEIRSHVPTSEGSRLPTEPPGRPAALLYCTDVTSLTKLVNIFSFRVVCVCVCVFFLPNHSGHQVRWTYQPGSHRQEEGHTGFLIQLPSAVRALTFLARRIQPFLSLADREVEFLVFIVRTENYRSKIEWHKIAFYAGWAQNRPLNFSREKDSAIPFPRRP